MSKAADRSSKMNDISGIYCDNDINDDNSGNPVSLEKCISFLFLPPNRVL